MRLPLAVVVMVSICSHEAAAQVPNQNQNNANPRFRNTVNTNPTSNAAGGTAAGGTGGTAAGGTAAGGTAGATANPAASANPVASSGSSTVGIQTGNTTTNIPSDSIIRAAPPIYVPNVSTGNVCALGASGGASWLGAGFAFGASWESMQCERRQTAALLWNMNTPDSKAAAKEILCNSPEIREAYARAGAPCTVDLARVAGAAGNGGTTPSQTAPQQIPPPPVRVAFDATPYGRASDCLTAAQAQGAPLSLCAGKR